MTKEEFLLHLYNSLDLSDAYHGCDQYAYEHAKKLVAVAERAKKCFHRMGELGLDEEDDFDNLMEAILDIDQI